MGSAQPRVILAQIRFWTWLFIVGLVISGLTAIPLRTEVNYLVKILGAQQLMERSSAPAPAWAFWLTRVQNALEETGGKAPFLFYGTDWLAFGHFMIALAFIGAIRDPVRNRWLFDFGLIACALVIPYALIFGAVRGIPFWWRCIDCCFGIFGTIPLWLAKRAVARLVEARGEA